MLNKLKNFVIKNQYKTLELVFGILGLFAILIYKFGFLKGIYAGLSIAVISLSLIPFALTYLIRDKKITINFKSIIMFLIFIIWLIIGLYFVSLQSVLTVITLGIVFFIVYKLV